MWKLHNKHLNKKWIKDGIKRKIRIYLEMNKNENTTHNMGNGECSA